MAATWTVVPRYRGDVCCILCQRNSYLSPVVLVCVQCVCTRKVHDCAYLHHYRNVVRVWTCCQWVLSHCRCDWSTMLFYVQHFMTSRDLNQETMLSRLTFSLFIALLRTSGRCAQVMRLKIVFSQICSPLYYYCLSDCDVQVLILVPLRNSKLQLYCKILIRCSSCRILFSLSSISNASCYVHKRWGGNSVLSSPYYLINQVSSSCDQRIVCDNDSSHILYEYGDT